MQQVRRALKGRGSQYAHAVQRRFFTSEPASRIEGFGESIFTTMTKLSVAHGAANLGQGAPDFKPPQFVLDNAEVALKVDRHQYQRSMGSLVLTEALSKLYSPGFGRTLDAQTEILISNGATEGGFSSIMAFVNPGDEVISFEPYYDAYPAWTQLAGGKMKYIPLRPSSSKRSGGSLTASDFIFDPVELEKAVKSPKAKVLLLNTPHNPLGKIFSKEELETIANIVKKNDKLIVLTDEVYDFLHHKNATKAPRFASLPGMSIRTVTLGSAGKMFSCTGWKVGWVITNPTLASAIQKFHQWNVFSVASPLQHAIGESINQAMTNGYFDRLVEDFSSRHDKLYNGLRSAGLDPIAAQAGYFIVTDVSSLKNNKNLGLTNEEKSLLVDDNTSHDTSSSQRKEFDVVVAEKLCIEKGVTGIPVSAFYSNEHKHLGNRYIRFAYCKGLDLIEQGIERLNKLNQ